MADYKLAYFPIRGRAEPMRLAFAAGGKKFEDVRISEEQWMSTEKANTPYGSLPYLVFKGTTYGESKAIASFVARECSMAGKTSADAMRVDEAYCLHGSLLDAMVKLQFEPDEAKKAAAGKTLAEETVPKFLGFFEKLVKQGSNGFCVASALSMADLIIYDITESILAMSPTALDSCPEIQKCRKNVGDNAKVKAYLASRPKSDF